MEKVSANWGNLVLTRRCSRSFKFKCYELGSILHFQNEVRGITEGNLLDSSIADNDGLRFVRDGQEIRAQVFAI